jgi:hypothetical protein
MYDPDGWSSPGSVTLALTRQEDTAAPQLTSSAAGYIGGEISARCGE